MSRYREVFTLPEAADPGRVFYTITAADVHKAVIETTAGKIAVIGFMGRVQPGDVGRRIYRVPRDDPDGGWTWQAENDEQRYRRYRQPPYTPDDQAAG